MNRRSFIVGLSLLLVSASRAYICDRIPRPADIPKPNLDKYVIEISGNPETYLPGETYTISLKTSPSNPITNTFSEFMLVVEPQTLTDTLQSVVTGDLAPLDYSVAKFTSKCPNAIIQTNNLAKSNVEISWKAPPSGNGCLAFKATVFESSDSWFTDDGGLTKVLCEEPENKDVQPPTLDECNACNEAKYEVAFQGMWTRNTHPKDYPPNMWTTKLGEVIGASHKIIRPFWNYYVPASPGLQLLAEEGDPSILEDELKEMVKSDDIRTIIKARELSYPNITGISYTVFRVDKEHHLISLVSKVTPSPDWIVGVANLELCTPEGGWVESRTLNLYPWDVGTDDGTSYNSPDSPASPPKHITPITSTLEDYPFYSPDGEPVKPMAQLRVTRQKVYEKACESNEEDDPCKMTEWSPWSGCSTTCGASVMTRDHQLVNPDNEAECTKEGPLELQQTERCKTSEDCGEPSECVNAIWGDWSACNVTCGVGTKTRYGRLSTEEEKEEEEEEENTCEETVQCYMPECESETTDEEVTFPPYNSQIVDQGPMGSVIDCEVSEWEEWGPCSATEPCTRGRQSRFRHIVTHPRNGGKACPKLKDLKRCRVPCSDRKKPRKHSNVVDCVMGPWSRWSPCSSNCGSAVQKRVRTILVHPRNGGKACGSRIDERKCSLPYACSDRESGNLY